jgi:hypothetical protein
LAKHDKPEVSASTNKTVTALLPGGLLAEVPARENQPLWRRDNEDRVIGAVITQAGFAALRIADVVTVAELRNGAVVIASEAPENLASDQPSSPAFRTGTKRALIIELLRRSDGASLDELVAATGSLPAAFTGLRHKGFVLEKLTLGRCPMHAETQTAYLDHTALKDACIVALMINAATQCCAERCGARLRSHQ